MTEEFKELKDYTQNLLNSFPINMLESERIFIEQIDKLFEDNNEVNIEGARKFIGIIENYLKMKQKMLIQQEDYKFLKELASKLREQEIRKSDQSNPALFKITNKIGEDMYYFTRKSANEYKEINTDAKINLINTNSFEIARLVDILKRNF